MNKLSFASFPALILIIVGAFLVLNYFNVISLSQIYPQYFGKLPHVSFRITKSKIFACPVTKSVCKTGKEIYDGNTYLGIGYTLPISYSIYAAISGRAVFGGAQDATKKVTSHAKIILGEKDNNSYVVTYEYFGIPSISNQSRDVKAGELLGTVFGGYFPKDNVFNGINVLIKFKSSIGQEIHPKVSDFE